MSKAHRYALPVVPLLGLLAACGPNVPAGPSPDFSGAEMTSHVVDATNPKVLHVVMHTKNHGTVTGTPVCESQASNHVWIAGGTATGHAALPGESQNVTINLVFDVVLDPQAVVIDMPLTHCNAK